MKSVFGSSILRIRTGVGQPMMQNLQASKRPVRYGRFCPLHLVGLGQVFFGEQVRRSEMFGCESVVLAEGPSAGRRAGLDLGLPLLVEDLDGHVSEACGQIGSVLL